MFYELVPIKEVKFFAFLVPRPVFKVFRATRYSPRDTESMNEEIHYKVIKLIEQDAEISQRALSKELGVSLGKVNYCLRALIEKGWVKAKNFKNSKNKLAYRYVLTPEGIQKRGELTSRFLKKKLAEYELLQREIEILRNEVKELGDIEKPTKWQ